jgi:hypothetical protein
MSKSNEPERTRTPDNRLRGSSAKRTKFLEIDPLGSAENGQVLGDFGQNVVPKSWTDFGGCGKVVPWMDRYTVG